jgi:hypothetical protein
MEYILHWNMVWNIMGYSRGLVTFVVEAYADATVALDHVSKSRCGSLTLIGGLIIFASSRIQTESELVSIMDNIGFLELFQELYTQ